MRVRSREIRCYSPGRVTTMSRKKRIRDLINKANAQKSTGPRTEAGKQRARLNAFRHGLSGQHLVLVEHEHAAYHALHDLMLHDLRPKTESEYQIALKIIDTNFRLNRISAIECNMFNLDSIDQTTDRDHDDRVEFMCAQTRAWKAGAHSFEILGRYEMRLHRQLLNYKHELERLQGIRKAEENVRQTEEPKALTPEMGSFGNPVPRYVMQDDIAEMAAEAEGAARDPRLPLSEPESDPMHVHSCNSWPSDSSQSPIALVTKPEQTKPLDSKMASFGTDTLAHKDPPIVSAALSQPVTQKAA